MQGKCSPQSQVVSNFVAHLFRISAVRQESRDLILHVAHVRTSDVLPRIRTLHHLAPVGSYPPVATLVSGT